MWVRTLSLVLLLVLPILSQAKLFGSELCQTQGYHCQKVKKGQSWKSLWPNPRERDIVMRVNRMNTQIYPGIHLAVPENLTNADVNDFSPFPKNIDPPDEKVVVVDPLAQAWAAYDATGLQVRWGPASLGADYCQDIDKQCHTHPGSYRLYTLGSSHCYSRKFPLPDGGAPMPYCMYFHNGQALHGEPNGLPGYNASHGCVRLYSNDAEWLRYSFVEGPTSGNDFRGTRIVIGNYDTPEDDDDNPYDQEDDSDEGDND